MRWPESGIPANGRLKSPVLAKKPGQSQRQTSQPDRTMTSRFSISSYPRNAWIRVGRSRKSIQPSIYLGSQPMADLNPSASSPESLAAPL